MSRFIDPSRLALPYAEWPIGDREAWNRAIAAGDIIDGEGPGAHWASATKCTNIQHYGRWLGYLLWRGELAPSTAPARRVTREAVRHYRDHLKTIVAPYTQLSMLVGLKVVIHAMAPEQSWRWLQDVCNRVQRFAKPSRDKRSRILPTDEIYNAALKELRLLPTEQLCIVDAIRYRDALMLALLAARPLRVKNFTALAFSRHFRSISDQWLITIPAEETKTHCHIEFFVPETLVPWFERYRDEVRTVFPNAAQSDLLWLNYRGSDLGYNFVRSRIKLITKRLFGRPINPHLLRDCAASTMATESVALARAAAPLLGHTQFSTTERYYLQANTIAASRRLNAILATVKASHKKR